MTKLNWEKDRRRRMPKDFCYDERPRSMAYDPESYLRALDRIYSTNSSNHPARPNNGLHERGNFNSRSTKSTQDDSTSSHKSSKYTDLDGLPSPWQTVIYEARAAIEAQKLGAPQSDRLAIVRIRNRLAHMRRIDIAYANHDAVIKVVDEINMAMRPLALH